MPQLHLVSMKRLYKIDLRFVNCNFISQSHSSINYLKYSWYNKGANGTLVSSISRTNSSRKLAAGNKEKNEQQKLCCNQQSFYSIQNDYQQSIITKLSCITTKLSYRLIPILLSSTNEMNSTYFFPTDTSLEQAPLLMLLNQHHSGQIKVDYNPTKVSWPEVSHIFLFAQGKTCHKTDQFPNQPLA